MKITDEERAELRRLRIAKRMGWRDPTRSHRVKPPSRPPTKHEQTVRALCAELGLLRKGFRETVHKELTWSTPPGLSDDELQAIPDPEDGKVPWDEVETALSLRPDAFAIVGTELHCYEVVDGCRLDTKRRFAYGDLGFAFDTWDGTVRLWVCDIYGNRAEQDLMQWWFDDCMPVFQAGRAIAETLSEA